MRKIFCKKNKEEAEGLEKAPYPGPIGEEIYNHISKPAWKEWLSVQTMLINENRLNLTDPEARRFLEEKMVGHLFEDKHAKPDGYKPE